MKYRHKNFGGAPLGVKTDDGKDQTVVFPGQEIILNRKAEGNGLRIVEKIEEPEKKEKVKKKDKEDY